MYSSQITSGIEECAGFQIILSAKYFGRGLLLSGEIIFFIRSDMLLKNALIHQ